MSDINQITNPDSRYISGPINVIRLEGQIGDVSKVLYLFMDYHLDVRDQTECANIFSQDVQNYFTDSFYKLNKSSQTYDFFVETFPSSLASTPYVKNPEPVDHKDRYIDQIIKLFTKLFRYDPKKNQVRINKLFGNIRLHYLDIRDYYEHAFYPLLFELRDIVSGFMQKDYISSQSLIVVIDLLQEMRNHIELILSTLLKTNSDKITKPKIISNLEKATDINAIEYLTRKIKTNYKYPKVKNAMASLLGLSIKNFQSIVKDINRMIPEFTLYAKRLSNMDKLTLDENTSYVYAYGPSQYTIRLMILSIVNQVEKLVDEKFIEFFARFTDIFFLRRFLDKDYITHGIVYAGSFHSNTYIDVLVKKFDFRITHAYYSKMKNLADLNTQAQKRPLMDIVELILPPDLSQCSNMDGFPEDFL